MKVYPYTELTLRLFFAGLLALALAAVAFVAAIAFFGPIAVAGAAAAIAVAALVVAWALGRGEREAGLI